jgi:hypothetical protein
VNNNKNKILYSVLNKEGVTILHISVDSRNSESLKNFYETLEKRSNKELEGEITHGSSYSTLKVLLEGEIEKYEDILYPFVDSIKNKNRYEGRRHFIGS